MANKTEEQKAVFEVLNKVNVNSHTETKDTGKAKLTYLSWAWAWAEVKQRYPEATYEIVKFNGLPYAFDEKTGYMVYTTVTIEGIKHEMWLPVMDGNNRAMLSHPYQITFKNGSTITVQPATMFDINKTIMRCLTKNLAMFGLGLYIYAGEDLPEKPEEEKITMQEPEPTTAPDPDATSEQNEPEDPEKARIKAKYQELITFCTKNKLNINEIAETCGLSAKSGYSAFETALAYAETIALTGGAK